jgi:hypothetical protein
MSEWITIRKSSKRVKPEELELLRQRSDGGRRGVIRDEEEAEVRVKRGEEERGEEKGEESRQKKGERGVFFLTSSPRTPYVLLSGAG